MARIPSFTVFMIVGNNLVSEVVTATDAPQASINAVKIAGKYGAKAEALFVLDGRISAEIKLPVGMRLVLVPVVEECIASANCAADETDFSS